jgi:hypothetical protein
VDRAAERARRPARRTAAAGSKSGELVRLLWARVRKGKGAGRTLTSTRRSCEEKGVREEVEEEIDADGLRRRSGLRRWRCCTGEGEKVLDAEGAWARGGRGAFIGGEGRGWGVAKAVEERVGGRPALNGGAQWCGRCRRGRGEVAVPMH